MNDADKQRLLQIEQQWQSLVQGTSNDVVAELARRGAEVSGRILQLADCADQATTKALLHAIEAEAEICFCTADLMDDLRKLVQGKYELLPPRPEVTSPPLLAWLLGAPQKTAAR